MRARQNNHKSIYIIKNRMVKTPKKLILISSLALTSSLFFFSNPTLTIKADASDDTQQQLVSDTPNQSPTNISTNEDKITASQSKTSTLDNNNGQVNNENTQVPESKVTSTSSLIGNNNDSDGKDSNDLTKEQNIPAPENEPAPVTTPSSTSTTGYDIPTDNYATGSYGDPSATDSKWYISNDKTELHFGPGTFKDNTSQVLPWSEKSSDITKIYFDGPSVAAKHMDYTFANLPNLTTVNTIQRLDTKNTWDFVGMFTNDKSLKYLDLSPFALNSVSNLSKMFMNDPSLINVDFIGWSGKSSSRGLNDLTSMFEGDTSLKTVDLNGWYVHNVEWMTNMFKDDTSLTSVGLKFQQDTPMLNTFGSLQTVKNMFKNDSSLKTLDLSTWDAFTKGTPYKTLGMFDGTNLDSITLSKKNSFNRNTTLPSSDSPKWINIGSADSPLATISFPTTNIAEYYNDPIENGHEDIHTETFVPSSNLVTANVNIPSNLGIQVVKNMTGLKGTTISVNTPQITNYTVDKKTIKATISAEGKILTTDNIIYTAIPGSSITADVTIPSNLGSQIVHNVTGQVGKNITIKVPVLSGYTANKQTVTAIANNGKIITNDTVLYTKNIVHHNSSSSHHTNKVPSDTNNVHLDRINIDISTFSDQPNVELYAWDSGHIMNIIKNRELAHGTDWFSDEKLTINNKSYYRVSTNEWVDVNKVYQYVEKHENIQVNNNSNKMLYKAEGSKVKNRELSRNSNWYSDRIGYINGDKYYRVATNEFVKPNDISLFKDFN